MNKITLSGLALAVLTGLAASSAPAVARIGADEISDHVLQCRDCNDPPDHIRQARGDDDKADHVRRNRGGDEMAAEDGDRGRGQGHGRGRGGDDVAEAARGKDNGRSQRHDHSNNEPEGD